MAAVRSEAENRRVLSAGLLAWEEWALGVAHRVDLVGGRVATSADGA